MFSIKCLTCLPHCLQLTFLLHRIILDILTYTSITLSGKQRCSRIVKVFGLWYFCSLVKRITVQHFCFCPCGLWGGGGGYQPHLKSPYMFACLFFILVLQPLRVSSQAYPNLLGTKMLCCCLFVLPFMWSLEGSFVHIAPACVGSREGSSHFGSYVRSLQHFDLNP
jgi:hypothetical protein